MTSKNILHNNKKSNLFLNKVVNQFNYVAPIQNINHQKNIFTVIPVIGPGSVYGVRMTFEIPKDIGIISELYIQSQITCTGDNSSLQDRLGSRIFKDIFLQTVRGPNTIQHINTDYINARVDLLQFKELTIAGMEPSPSFNNTTSTVYTPLFFELGFDTNFVEKLQLTTVVNDSYTALGLSSNTVTSIVPKLFIVSYTLEESFRKSYRMISYNIFNEEPVEITASSTSLKTFLECDKQVNSIHMVIRNTNQEYVRINSFSIESNGQELVPELPSFINNNNCDIGMTYSYYFNSDRNRLSLSGLNLDFLNPLHLTVNYDTIGSGYSLYIFYEYSTINYIGSRGSIDTVS